MYRRPLAILFCLLLVTPVHAQKGRSRDRQAGRGGNDRQVELFQSVLRDLGPEGQTLDVVHVPAGWGDGRITERDGLALARYCVWGFNRVLEMEGMEAQLGGDAEVRMLEFWVYVWDHVDDETKQIVSVADHLWPQISMAYELGNQTQRQAMVRQFAEFVDEIWGEDLALVTVQYLAGVLSGQDYAQIIDGAIQEMYSYSVSGSQGGGVGSGSMDVMASYTPAEESYVMNDGSGDIVYPDNE